MVLWRWGPENAALDADSIQTLIRRTEADDMDAADTLSKFGVGSVAASRALVELAQRAAHRPRAIGVLARLTVATSASQTTPAVRDALAGLPRAAALTPLLEALDAEWRVEAADALASLGAEAHSAGPALASAVIDSAEEPEVRTACARALARIDPVALREALARVAAQRTNSIDPQALLNTAEVLLEVRGDEGDDQAGLTLLAPLLASPDARIRSQAVQLLPRLGVHALPTLTAAARDEDTHVRCVAYRALACLGPDAEPALPELIAGLDAEDPQQSGAAAEAVAELGSAGAPAVPALVRLIERTRGSVECEVLRAAIHALGQIGDEATAGIPALMAVLQETEVQDTDDIDAQWDAITALGRIGRATPDVVEALTRSLSSGAGYGDLDEAAADALGRLGPEAASATPALIAALRAGHPNRETVIWALGRQGAAASAALPLLTEALAGPAPVSARAAQAILRIEPGQREAVLRRLAELDADPAVRAAAAAAPSD